MKRFWKVLAALVAALLGAFMLAGPANAGPTRTTHVYYKMLHFAVASDGYTYAVDQYWKITEWASTTTPTTFHMDNEDEGTAPHFDANLVEFDGLDGIMYKHGTGALNSVPNTLTNQHPSLYGVGTTYTSYGMDTWDSVLDQTMWVYGVGPGNAYTIKSDSIPTVSNWTP